MAGFHSSGSEKRHPEWRTKFAASAANALELAAWRCVQPALRWLVFAVPANKVASSPAGSARDGRMVTQRTATRLTVQKSAGDT
jgi:hypothetical protein